MDGMGKRNSHTKMDTRLKACFEVDNHGLP